jgi:hypothetical protein
MSVGSPGAWDSCCQLRACGNSIQVEGHALISSWSQRSMGMMPISWWSGSIVVVLKAPAMWQTAVF